MNKKKNVLVGESGFFILFCFNDFWWVGGGVRKAGRPFTLTLDDVEDPK